MKLSNRSPRLRKYVFPGRGVHFVNWFPALLRIMWPHAEHLCQTVPSANQEGGTRAPTTPHERVSKTDFTLLEKVSLPQVAGVKG